MDFRYPKVTVKDDRLKSIKAGHPWVFSGGISSLPPNLPNGEVCTICDQHNQFLAIGYYNKNSDIRLRILSWENEEINKAFFHRRIETLRNLKEGFLPENTNAYRVVFGESDLLPGLVIDKYDDVLVIQIHTLGMDKFREAIVTAIKGIFQPATIYERSDLEIRLKEGLKTQPHQFLYGQDREEVLIKENGLSFWVNFQKGQKTGFFLDQRENRLLLTRFCRMRRVLNCFSYTGGFSVYAALHGAKAVTSVDLSQHALNYAERNFEENHLNVKKHRFIKEDVFSYLQGIEKGEYDLIILDPPSFAKKKDQLKSAIKAYTTINSKALEKLPLHGILVSSSCTTHLDELTFLKILHRSSANTRCMVKILAGSLQPFDHPYNLSFPEGRYLKFFIGQKIYEM